MATAADRQQGLLPPSAWPAIAQASLSKDVYGVDDALRSIAGTRFRAEEPVV